MTDEAQWARAGRGSPVHELLAHDVAVLPFLDRNLGHVHCAPLRVVNVEPPDHERPVARDHIAVVGVSSHSRDFGQEVLLEGAVGGLATLAYREVGAGSPLILIHGSPGDGRSWSRLVPRLAEHCRVITPDLPAAYAERVTGGELAAVGEMVDYWFGAGSFAQMHPSARKFLIAGAARNGLDVRATFAERLTVDQLAGFTNKVLAAYGGGSPPAVQAIIAALVGLSSAAARRPRRIARHARQPP
jgi:hypothetical protein